MPDALDYLIVYFYLICYMPFLNIFLTILWVQILLVLKNLIIFFSIDFFLLSFILL
jgi:hypothetical protein